MSVQGPCTPPPAVGIPSLLLDLLKGRVGPDVPTAVVELGPGPVCLGGTDECSPGWLCRHPRIHSSDQAWIECWVLPRCLPSPGAQGLLGDRP